MQVQYFSLLVRSTRASNQQYLQFLSCTSEKSLTGPPLSSYLFYLYLILSYSFILAIYLHHPFYSVSRMGPKYKNIDLYRASRNSRILQGSLSTQVENYFSITPYPSISSSGVKRSLNTLALNLDWMLSIPPICSANLEAQQYWLFN